MDIDQGFIGGLKVYLSKLSLDLRCPRVRRELSDIYELHRTILHAFPDGQDGPGRVLFRLENSTDEQVSILVQSCEAPDWTKVRVPKDFFVTPPLSKPFDPQLVPGQALVFRLKANPTVKRDGKRWGLVKEEDLRAWMSRKAAEGGFSITSLRVLPQDAVEGVKEGIEGVLRFSSAIFEGTLSIEDVTMFKRTLDSGIGSGKGFGFGLFSIAPMR